MMRIQLPMMSAASAVSRARMMLTLWGDVESVAFFRVGRSAAQLGPSAPGFLIGPHDTDYRLVVMRRESARMVAA